MNSLKYRLSKISLFLLANFSDEHLRETIMDDLDDSFEENVERRGSIYAGTVWLCKLLLILTAFFLKSFVWRGIMFKDHIKITLRNIRKHKGYSFINISGLSIGLACTILIFLWVKDELSFDRFHENADRIYRVVFSTSDDGSLSPTNANGSFGIGPALKKEFPEVLETVRIRKMGQSVKRYIGYKDKKFYESRFFFAEPSILTVFNFPLVKGDISKALIEPNTMILTEEMAKKYFGNEDPIGKMIEADPYNDGELMLFRITGVAGNVPHNSHIHYDFLASYSSQKDDTENLNGFYQNFTYVLLNSGTKAAILNSKLLDFLHRNWQKDPWYTISLQPLLDIRLHSNLRSEFEATGNILYIYIFSAVALFVLVIACINFINLTTARAVKRAKEVGIRKVVGARKKQLVYQYLGESLILSMISALGAILFIIIALPSFNQLTGKGIALHSIFDPAFVLGLALLVTAVGFLSGIYPAFFLSAFQPINSIKTGNTSPASGAGLRKGLVIFQFALSIGIIFATLIVRKQMDYIQSRNLGYDRKQIMVIPLNRDLRQNYEGFKGELLRYPQIENMTTSSYVPTRGSMHLSLRFEGKEERISQVIYGVDKEFARTYGLQILTGKDIYNPVSQEGTADFLVSKLTIREAGYSSPEEVIGKSVELEEYKGHIAGVVNDINIYSLHRDPYSISYVITSIKNHNYLSIRIHPHNMSETIGHIRNTWQEMIPAYPLDYFFLDASFEQMHLSEKKMSEIFSIFSVLAIMVACMGLFGLAAYTAEQKTKEIGVRKILGASALTIYLLLSREFLKYVVLANIIAWPATYFIMQEWLRNFAFRTVISWEIFLISGGTALVISILTVSSQAVQASTANPVDSLRYE